MTITERALVELTLLGAACGPLGVWVLLHKRAFATESLSHALLPGLVLAGIVGAPLALGAAGGVAVAAGAIALAGRDPRIGPDAGVAVAVGALVGAGALLAQSPQAPPNLEQLLFGDPLGATDGDLATSAVLAVGSLAALAALHRRLTASAFDGSRSDLPLLAVLAAVTVAAAPVLGNLLLVALVLAPAAAALVLADRIHTALALAAGLAVACAAAGLGASYALDIATGPAVALSSVAVLAVAAAR